MPDWPIGSVSDFTSEPTNKTKSMKPICKSIALLAIALAGFTTTYAQDPLPSWNDGAGEAGDRRVRAGDHDKASPKFVPPEERIATFDQDGTLWVEHPMYTQVIYCLDRVPAVVEGEAGTARRSSRSRPCCRAIARRSPNSR